MQKDGEEEGGCNVIAERRRFKGELYDISKIINYSAPHALRTLAENFLHARVSE